MRVISNHEAEAGTVEVEVISSGKKGTIIGHNNKSMKFGRLYKVKVDNSEIEASGSDLKRLTT